MPDRDENKAGAMQRDGIMHSYRRIGGAERPLNA